MYFEEEEYLPSLIPISKRKKQYISNEPKAEEKKNQVTGIKVFNKESSSKLRLQQQKKQSEVQKQQKQAEPMPQARAQEFDARFKAMNEQIIKKQEKEKQKGKTDKWKEFDKSKELIDQIIHKINAKNISQELYPATNQTIFQLIKKIDEEMADLKVEAEKKENSLASNPQNQHLKKQLQGVKIAIDRTQTIKQLYNEKINMRNKITTLERNIINIKEQNMNLKIKISRGIETIQSHMHNLPCQRQKQLKQELNKCQSEWKRQKEMRQSLQSNINQIVLNFKRLYQEAETARIIVTRKLAEVLDKQKVILAAAKENQSKEFSDKQDKRSSPVSNISPPTVTQMKRKQPNQNDVLETYKKNAAKISYNPNQSTDSKKTQSYQRPKHGMFSLEQQIKKMRNNQTNIVTLQNKQL